MASLKSHAIPPSRSEPQAPSTQRRLSSRLPSRTVTPTSSSQPESTAHTTRLHKRRTARENDEMRSSSGKSHSSSRSKVAQPMLAERPRAGRERLAPPPTHGSSKMSSRSAAPPSSVRSGRLDGYSNPRTPSLVSGSSVSTVESPASGLLKRKQSSIGRAAPQVRQGSASSQDEPQIYRTGRAAYADPFSDSVLGITLPQSNSMHFRRGAPQEQGQEYGMPHKIATEDLPPPTPLYANSATPSTGYSDSPSGFSHVSTPTSMSSHSPGLAVTQKPVTRIKQQSPLQSRPPVTRRVTDERFDPEKRSLPSVQESSASSSSGSTIRPTNNGSRDREGSKNMQQPTPTSAPVQTSRSQKSSKIAPPPSKPLVQRPPEFAHLAVDTKSQNQVSQRPARPSRDGTPEMSGLRQLSPIIQSNLASLPSHHRRQSSIDSKLGMSLAAGNTSRTKLTKSPKAPSRNPSPAMNSSSLAPSTTRIPMSRGPTPDIPSDSEKMAAQAKTVMTPSPVKSGSRFGFFRRNKTEPTPPVPKTEKKLLRKGPMAGTGHEGYGKYKNRTRNGSTTSVTGNPGRSPSQESVGLAAQKTPSTRKGSLASQKDGELDDYFRNRLSPVVIRGGSNDICRSPDDFRSTSSLDSTVQEIMSPGTESNTSSIAVDTAPTTLDTGSARPTLLPSAIPEARGGSPMKRFGFGFRRPSDSEDEKKSGHVRTIAARRSFRRSQMLEPPSRVSNDATDSRRPSASDVSVREVDVSEGKEGSWLKPKKSATKAQPKLTRKWNFFQRAAHPTKDSTDLGPSLVKAAPSRSVPHYAIMDGGNDIDMDDLERIMQEAAKSPEVKPIDSTKRELAMQDDNQEEDEQERVEVQKAEHHSMLLPSPPLLPPSLPRSTRPASPKVMLRKEQEPSIEPSDAPTSQIKDEPTADAVPAETATAPTKVNGGPARAFRLKPLGRIPPVVSKRDRDVNLSGSSFSRPFAPSKPSPAIQASRTSVDSIQLPLVADNSVLSNAYPAFHGPGSPFNQATFEVPPLSFGRNEFLKFPPRKDSEVSQSSSSGVWSIPHLALASPPGAPLSEDEVWNEYDDLIDEVLSPADESVTSPLSANETTNDTVEPPNEGGDDKNEGEDDAPCSAHTSISSLPQSIHLRRSRLLSALDAGSPRSQTYPSISDLHSQYGERSINVVDQTTGRLSLRASRDGTLKSRTNSLRSSLPNSVGVAPRRSKSTITSSDERRVSARYRDTREIEKAENDKEGLESMANLRFGALMTSKWLSFGRVLFSPVHFDLKDSAEDRVLVIDGLGKDWSYYCALTYPEATIFHLSPESEATNSVAPWSSNVPNHKHTQHSNMQQMFPFPNRYFAAVVYRFPLAASEATYRNCIAECKRVLRPGGYLELSILDLDLINMGNRARKAMRELKQQMAIEEPEVSLKPVSDMIMRLIGRKGFENINRFMAAVPVAAGRVTSWSSDSSCASDSLSKTTSKTKSTSREIGFEKVDPNKHSKRSSGKSKKRASRLKAPTPNFTDLLGAPPSPDPAVASETDANISDMVARVGRWWYSRCYESAVLPEGELAESLWSDTALLRECETGGTSFRLLVAYAQKPMCAVRRTVSV